MLPLLAHCIPTMTFLHYVRGYSQYMSMPQAICARYGVIGRSANFQCMHPLTLTVKVATTPTNVSTGVGWGTRWPPAQVEYQR